MANRKCRMVRSCKVNGKWKYLSVARAKKLRIPDDEGRWYITWREGRHTQWLPARDYGHAYTLLKTKEAELHAAAFGIKVTPNDPKRLTIENAMTQFKEDLTMLDRKDQTLGAYDLVFNAFRSTCKKRWLDEIERRDLLQFAQRMRKDGLSPRTVSNRWLVFQSFLKHFKITGLTTRKDAPKYVETEPEAYTKEETETFFAACKNERQRTLFRFFLMTGAREQEVMYATWPDIDLKEKTFRVTAKSEYGFRPKSWEERSIPLEDGLVLALGHLQSGLKRGSLVSPHGIRSRIRKCCWRVRAWRGGRSWTLRNSGCTSSEQRSSRGTPTRECRSQPSSSGPVTRTWRRRCVTSSRTEVPK